MASIVVNGPNPTPLLKRGVPTNLGSLTNAADVVQFTLPHVSNGTDGAEELTIITTGGTITVALEASIDGGASWFGVPALAASLNVTVINADPAASSANRFDVAGLQAGALFRLGSTARTGTNAVWALVG